jgi:hypothetical protein
MGSRSLGPLGGLGPSLGVKCRHTPFSSRVASSYMHVTSRENKGLWSGEGVGLSGGEIRVLHVGCLEFGFRLGIGSRSQQFVLISTKFHWNTILIPIFVTALGCVQALPWRFAPFSSHIRLCASLNPERPPTWAMFNTHPEGLLNFLATSGYAQASPRRATHFYSHIRLCLSLTPKECSFF